MRETWLEENQRLVAIDNFGNDLPAVEAATKKHEAIETDIMVCFVDNLCYLLILATEQCLFWIILNVFIIKFILIPFQAYEERVNTLVAVADELVRENYHDADRIQNGKNKIIELWNILLVLLKQRRARLEKCMRLQRVFQEMINIIDWMDEIKVFLKP